MIMIYTVVVAVMKILRKKTNGKDNDGDGNYGINDDEVKGIMMMMIATHYITQYTYLV
jgi:hypothetical protein